MTTQTPPQNTAILIRKTATGEFYLISHVLLLKAQEIAENGRDGGYREG